MIVVLTIVYVPTVRFMVVERWTMRRGVLEYIEWVRWY